MNWRWSALFLGGAIAALPSVASAADAAADYSTVLNPNGVWSYGEFLSTLAVPAGPNQLQPASTFGAPFPPTVHAWHQPFANPLESSFVSAELAGAPTNLGSTQWDPGLLVLRPGVNDQAPFVRFRAPIAGTYAYTCTYAPADVVGGTRRVMTVVNGVIAHVSPLHGPIGGVIPVTHANAAGVFLAAGQSIEFVVTTDGSPADFREDAAALRNTKVDLIAGPIMNRPCRWIQPWTKPLGAHESVVADCAGSPVSFAGIKMDDFRCDEDAEMRRLTWWGTTGAPAAGAVLPPQRIFFIRIWATDPTNCTPIDPIFQDCVIARARPAGIDCQNRRVFRFAAVLNSPFQALSGEHYYLQISEVDDDPNNPFNIFPTSARPGVPDFEWSAHRPIRLCPAVGFDASGNFLIPLLDPCDDQPDDLAFTISSRFTVIIVSPLLPNGPPLRVELRDPDTGHLVDEQCEEADPTDGMMHVEFDAPDGIYNMCVFGGAAVGEKMMGVPISPLNVKPVEILLRMGDADNDGIVRFRDVTTVLGNWLQMSPMMPNGMPMP